MSDLPDLDLFRKEARAWLEQHAHKSGWAAKQVTHAITACAAPTVRDALAVPVTVAMLKGRSNYLCHYYLQRTADNGRLPSRQETRVSRGGTADPAPRATALLMPESAPEKRGGWAPITVEVRGATTRPIPRPKRRMPGKKLVQ